MKKIGMLPMNREFRSRFEYINPMYLVCSLIIERLSGKSYGEFLKERLFQANRNEKRVLPSQRIC